MANGNHSPLYDDFLLTLSHREPGRVPVVLWYTRSALGLQGGAKTLLEYYRNPEIKLATQQYPLEAFPEVLVFPGIYPDYGVAVEASAFNCPIRFFDNSPPRPFPLIESIKDVNRVKAIDPHRDGLMPQALKEYEYLLTHLDRKHVSRLPYLDGCVWVMGPLEVAGFILGHEKLFLSLYDEPGLVHRLLTIVTDGLIAWLRALEKVAGELKLICLVEHTPGQISAAHSEAFFFPYCSEIFRQFPQACRLYHNEDRIRHIMARLPRLGAHIWHTGPWDLLEIKEAVGREMTVMGNIHPIQTLLNGTPEEVTEACRQSLAAGAPGGGFLLSSGGGLAPETPLENIRALIRSASAGLP
jgi:uroporphyrinogen decarboxylase